MNIIITGASRGIGYATALELAQYPTHQVYVLSRNAAALEALADTGEKKYGYRNIHVVPFDLRTPQDIKTHLSIEQLDVLIHNAGYLLNKDFKEVTLDDWQKSFEVNIFGVAQLTQKLLPLLEASPRAHVVMISSMGGVQGSSKFPGLSVYSASKAALANLTECLAEEYKESTIRFNCLALGAVQTEMLAAAFPDYEAPLTSKEMAEYLADFSLNGHRFFNGKILPVAISTP
ncbi:MAG: SDR family oxidoreductase [Bacteroidota bacterium]